MKRVLGVARLVFVNQFKSMWRQFRPGKLYKKPGFVLAVIFYALIFLNMLYTAYRNYVNSVNAISFDPRPPNNWLLNLVGDVLSALFLIYIFVQYFIRKNVMSIPPGLEFLLYQPLRAWEIYAGMLVGSAAFIMFSLTVMLIIFSFLIPWFAFLILYVFTYALFVIDPVFFTVSRILRKSGRMSVPLALIQAYLLVGFAHTLFTTYSNDRPTVSPLLSYPVKGVYVLTLSLYEHVGYAGFLIYLLSTFLVALASTSTLGKRLEVSDFTSFRDAYEARLARELKKSLNRDVLTDWSSPDDALRRVALEFTVYNSRLVLRGYVPVFTALLAAGFLVRTVFLNQGVSPMDQPYLMIIVFAAMLLAHNSFLRELLINDLKCLWVIRIYLSNLKQFSRVLMLKYTIAYLVSVTAVSGFVSSLNLNPLVLVAPLIVLPLLTTSVFTTLLTATLLTRRARHHEPAAEIYRHGALPMVDPVSQMLLLPMLALISITYLGVFTTYFLIIENVLTYTHVALITTCSVTLAYLLYRLLSRLLAKALLKIDLHF